MNKGLRFKLFVVFMEVINLDCFLIMNKYLVVFPLELIIRPKQDTLKLGKLELRWAMYTTIVV